MEKPGALAPSLAKLYEELTKREHHREQEERIDKLAEQLLKDADEAKPKKMILAIDDIQEVLNTLSIILDDDYDIRLARRIDVAIALLKENHFDLFILDYGMPELSGIEFLSVIRSFKEYKNTPIMFLSANRDEKIVKKALSLGVKDYIAKPINPEFLKIRIRDIFDNIDL